MNPSRRPKEGKRIASSPRERYRRFGFGASAVLLLLLVIPGLALVVLSAALDWRLVLAYLSIMSVLTLFLYGSDKRKARAGEWRIPESTLHLAELGGGWPAAFVAQRWFRHKISKGSFQATYWLIVILHQLAAVDYLRNWPMLKALVQLARD